LIEFKLSYSLTLESEMEKKTLYRARSKNKAGVPKNKALRLAVYKPPPQNQGAAAEGKKGPVHQAAGHTHAAAPGVLRRAAPCAKAIGVRGERGALLKPEPIGG
jgi:hypothetical protein